MKLLKPAWVNHEGKEIFLFFTLINLFLLLYCSQNLTLLAFFYFDQVILYFQLIFIQINQGLPLVDKVSAIKSLSSIKK